MALDSSSSPDDNKDRMESLSSYHAIELSLSSLQTTIIELAKKLTAGKMKWVDEACLCHIFDYRVNINMYCNDKT